MDVGSPSTKILPDGGYIKSCGVTQDDVCSSTWMAWRTCNYTAPQPLITEVLEGGFEENLNGTHFILGFNLGSILPRSSSLNVPPVGYISPTSGNPCGVWVSCQYGAFPIWLYNATDVTTNASTVTTVNGVPSVTLNETFGDIQLDTGGHGASTVNLLVSQQITGNATTMIAQVDVYADLSNMHLYLPDGTEIPQGTDYSLNLLWQTSLVNASETRPNLVVGFPYTIVGNSLYFIVNGEVGNLAGIKLDDNYVANQGVTQTSSRQAQIQFVSSTTTAGTPNNDTVPECLCLQTYANLTYGVTTSVLSDPTLYMDHAVVYSYLPLIIVIVIVAVVVIAAVVLFRHRRTKKADKTVTDKNP